MYSWALTHRSVAGSGIGFGFDQMMSCRSHHPSFCKARATLHGMPMRSLGLRVLMLRPFPLWCSAPIFPWNPLSFLWCG